MTSLLIFLVCISAALRLLRRILNAYHSMRIARRNDPPTVDLFTPKRLTIYLITLPLILVLDFLDATDELWQYLLLSRDGIHHIVEAMIREVAFLPKDLNLASLSEVSNRKVH